MNRWKGRTVLVTGASSGIGYATAKLLAQNGMNVVGAARNIEKIEALSTELSQSQSSGKVLAVKCDLTKDDQVFALFESAKSAFGGIDVCINNAGMSFSSSLLDGTPEEWRTANDLNIVALCLCTKLAVADMRERSVDDGHVINLSSILGHIVPAGTTARHFYTATKFAVRAITEGLRQELREAKSHIRASSISPGVVETEFGPRAANDEQKGKVVYKLIQCLQPEDVASGILTILSAPKHVEINDIIMRPTEQPI